MSMPNSEGPDSIEDGLSAGIGHARDRGHQLDGDAKRFEIGFDLVDFGDRRTQAVKEAYRLNKRGRA